MDAVELDVFASRLEAVCDEMGAVLRNAAFSPNIRDRLDFSCAVFGLCGDLAAQAAHIPIRLTLRIRDGRIHADFAGTSAQVPVLTERRRHRPWGLAGGAAGLQGANWLNDQPLPARCQRAVAAGDRLVIETTGEGGWGAVPA